MTEAPAQTITPEFLKQLFDRHLETMHAMFDADYGLIVEHLPARHKASVISYLSSCDAHPLIQSMWYARKLVETDDSAMHQRAVGIVRMVLEKQGTDPIAFVYGGWPHFHEEDLKTVKEVDHNRATHHGRFLAEFLLYHRSKFPPDLLDQMTLALERACVSMFRRNCPVWYTNVALDNAYTFELASRVLDRGDLLEAARAYFEGILGHAIEHGGVREYNSPNYSTHFLQLGSIVRTNVKDEQCRQLMTRIEDVGWEMLAKHFQPSVSQIAGPHTRGAKNFIRYDDLTPFQIALPELDLMDPEKMTFKWPMGWKNLSIICPDKYRHYFSDRTTTRSWTDRYYLGKADEPPEMAFCYVSPEFSLGSFYQSPWGMWEQHFNFMAYFGTVQEPIYLRSRMIHDDHDFSSGHLNCVQHEGRLIGIANFLTDGGEIHPFQDRVKDSTVQASNLRLRFEIGGAIDNVTDVRWESNHLSARIAGVPVDLKILYAVFDDASPVIEMKTTDGKIVCDVVFYQGPSRSIDFRTIQILGAAFSLECGEYSRAAVSAGLKKGVLRVDYQSPDCSMAISTTLKPGTKRALYTSMQQWLNGKQIVLDDRRYMNPGEGT